MSEDLEEVKEKVNVARILLESPTPNIKMLKSVVADSLELLAALSAAKPGERPKIVDDPSEEAWQRETWASGYGSTKLLYERFVALESYCTQLEAARRQDAEAVREAEERGAWAMWKYNQPTISERAMTEEYRINTINAALEQHRAHANQQGEGKL